MYGHLKCHFVSVPKSHNALIYQFLFLGILIVLDVEKYVYPRAFAYEHERQ